jgi:hypothetical protein
VDLAAAVAQTSVALEAVSGVAFEAVSGMGLIAVERPVLEVGHRMGAARGIFFGEANASCWAWRNVVG